ncbi:MAG TPA: formyltetrahydrofolate deformylase [Verrucomicrobiota bacterium]|nr:formyltetrahydrofolate deformylase [Verrucomicrobiota bacterium]
MSRYATITVIGRDKTGVVARVTNLLFETRANIEALEEQVTRGQFSMTIQVSWKASSFESKPIGQGLRALGRELGMEIKWWFTDPGRPQRMALMVTREPHCLDAILEAVKAGRLKAEIVAVIGNHRDLQAKAEKVGLPFHHVGWANRAKAEARVLRILEKAQADFVVLARFMKILSPNFVWRFKNKIINIHPSLLPSFPGPQPYRQAYEHGVKIAGVTAHFVSMHLDEGPIIAQESFRIKPGVTLKQIVAVGQKLESKALVNGIRLYLTKQLDVHWGVVNQV